MSRQTIESFLAETNADNPTFWLGGYIAHHTIGRYTFVEYKPWIHIDVLRRHQGFEEKSSYLIFVDGLDISRSASSIELAFLSAMAWQFDGPNSRAAIYCARALNLPDARFEKL
mgnify:CR=1 FL=1